MSELKKLFAGGIKETYKKGEVIINAFDKPDGVYFISKGFVQSYSLTADGNTNIQLIRSKGDVFPLLWGLGEITRDVYFSAMDNVVVRKLDLKTFQSQVKKSEVLKAELQTSLLEVYLLLAERVRCLEQRRVSDRLQYCLKNLAEKFGKQEDTFVVIKAPVHHHDLADMIGASREATSREFAKLENAGALGYQNGEIIVYAQA